MATLNAVTKPHKIQAIHSQLYVHCRRGEYVVYHHSCGYMVCFLKYLTVYFVMSSRNVKKEEKIILQKAN